MNPEVSIIIPTYNSEAYIRQALESIFNQTYVNFEVILVDDASEDSTLEIARNFRDTRLKIISNRQNRGVSHGRNCGIAIAKGSWIALLDSDDWYAPQRLEKLLLVAKQENADMVADDLHLIRDKPSGMASLREFQPWSTLLQENNQQTSSPKVISAVDFVKSDRPNPINKKRNWSLGYIKPLIRREFLIEHHIKYNETIRVGEDYILYLECLRQQARLILVPQAYYYYRTRVTSLSARSATAYLAESCDIAQFFVRQEAEIAEDSHLLPVLQENITIYQNRLAYHHVLETIKQKNIGRTIRQILVRPYTLKLLVKKSLAIVRNKLVSVTESKKSIYGEFGVAAIE